MGVLSYQLQIRMRMNPYSILRTSYVNDILKYSSYCTAKDWCKAGSGRNITSLGFFTAS